MEFQDSGRGGHLGFSMKEKMTENAYVFFSTTGPCVPNFMQIEQLKIGKYSVTAVILDFSMKTKVASNHSEHLYMYRHIKFRQDFKTFDFKTGPYSKYVKANSAYHMSISLTVLEE